jgi:hypothetical protein
MEEHKLGRRRPACFSSQEQYEEWRELANKTTGLSSGYCTDCTPEYKAEMLLQERCAHRNVEFGLDEDGLLAGFKPEMRRFIKPESVSMPTKKTKWLAPDQAPSVTYASVSSNWFPAAGTFIRIPRPKHEKKGTKDDTGEES